jgi:SAM-dependent methyltransferase
MLHGHSRKDANHTGNHLASTTEFPIRRTRGERPIGSYGRPRQCSVGSLAVDEVAGDGSPIAVYLRLPPGGTPELISRALPSGSMIVELGCGAGRITRALIALGHEVLAVDNSPAMLRHVRGARTVLSDIEALDLEERFDAVVLGSYLINSPDPAQRRAFLAACRQHVRIGGVVLIERYDPTWARSAHDQTREVGGVRVSWHFVRVDGSRLHASITYEIEQRSWTQEFTAEILDDDRLIAEAEAAGLAFECWIDPLREWARFSPTASDSSRH